MRQQDTGGNGLWKGGLEAVELGGADTYIPVDEAEAFTAPFLVDRTANNSDGGGGHGETNTHSGSNVRTPNERASRNAAARVAMQPPEAAGVTKSLDHILRSLGVVEETTEDESWQPRQEEEEFLEMKDAVEQIMEYKASFPRH